MPHKTIFDVKTFPFPKNNQKGFTFLLSYLAYMCVFKIIEVNRLRLLDQSLMFYK